MEAVGAGSEVGARAMATLMLEHGDNGGDVEGPVVEAMVVDKAAEVGAPRWGP